MAGKDILLVALFMWSLLLPFSQNDQRLKIGAIFAKDGGGMEDKIFRFAINSINKQRLLANVTLVALVSYASSTNAFENIYCANQLISEGVIAIIGPSTSTAVKAMHPLCRKFHVPHISPGATDPEFYYHSFERFSYLLRMTPSDLKLSLAMVDLIDHFKWERVGILTSSTDYGMNSLMDFKEIATSKGWTILAMEHFSVPAEGYKVNATRELLNLRETGARVVLLSCLDAYVPFVLEQAKELDMIKDWVWILTDGAITTDNNELSYIEGLIGLRMPVTAYGDLYKSVMTEWKESGEATAISGRAGKVYDAVLTVTHAVMAMTVKNLTFDEPSVGSGFCRSNRREIQPWADGEILLKDMKKVKTEGIMTYLEFSERTGSPRNIMYDVVNYQSEEGWVKVGEWNDNRVKPLKMERKRPIVWPSGGLETPKIASMLLKYRKIKVLIALSPPFVMKKEKTSDVNPESGYEGFCIDLLNELRRKLQFEYEIKLGEKFGTKQADGTWDGIIGELKREKANLAVSTFTISPERLKVVDFTQPYFSLGFKIIIKKTNTGRKANTWGFLDPFEKTLWIAIISSSVIIGLVVWIYDRLSPYGYYGRVVQSAVVTGEQTHERNTLSLFNSLWAAGASYLEQGPDGLHPISHSGRATSLAWWFAISIFGATYTANLAAFLTITKYEHPINTIEDLANQEEIRYGTAPGQLAEMLKSASLPVYEKLWRFIETHGTMEPNATYAIKKVRRTENYAFIWDSAVLEYEVQHEPCNTLMIMDRPFGNINYGFALPRNSPYTHNFSVAMLELQQEGFLERMTEKWFRSRSVCSAETQAAKDAEEEGGDQLSFLDLAGVFITLAAGVAASILVLMMEFVYASYKDTRSRDAKAPKTLAEAFSQRLHRTKIGLQQLYDGETKNKESCLITKTFPCHENEEPPLLNSRDERCLKKTGRKQPVIV